jgi:pilus assembly protein Flp/PilA
MQAIRKFFEDEAGASAVEYALLVALIAVALVTAISGLSTQIQSTFKSAADSLKGTSGTGG